LETTEEADRARCRPVLRNKWKATNTRQITSVPSHTNVSPNYLSLVRF
jgi:hypothetical protein